jgi:sporulation protein YlmC with PRC-barrel domain
MLLTEATGLRVISKATAEQLGSVQHLVVDPAASRFVGLHVKGRRLSKLLDWDVVVIGPDAAILEGEEHLREPSEGREAQAVDGVQDLLGKLTLSDRGNSCGSLRDVEFDPGTGQIVSIITDQGSIEGQRLAAIGSFAVIIESSEGTALSGL